jgi:hypothetical protein
MAAHRYWGLRIQSRYVTAFGGWATAIAEIEMAATPGGADQCSGGTPGADSSDGLTTPAMLFDNNAATSWERGAMSQVQVWYDFGVPVEVTEIRVTLPGSGASRPGGLYAPDVMTVLWSDAGSSAWSVGLPSVHHPVTTDGQVLTLAGVSDDAGPGTLVAVEHARLEPGWPEDPDNHAAVGAVFTWDQHSGPFRVAGDVAIEGTPDVPVGRRVRLLVKRTAELARETWSDPVTGAYAFDRVANRPYIVLSEDHTGVHNAAVTDAVTPVPMP